VETSIPKSPRGIVLCGALPGGGKGESLGEDHVDVTVTVPRGRTTSFARIVPLSEFLELLVASGAQGHKPDYLSLFRIEQASTLVGNAIKGSKKKKKVVRFFLFYFMED